MELENTFTLAAPVDECWVLLTDLERVASCMPGFTAAGWDGDVYTGAIKVKVGAVTVTYDARIQMVEKDDDGHRAVIEAEGRERRGQGKAAAKVRSQLREAGDATEVTMVADVDVTGRVAGFGRGILADVNNRLVTRFARNVETTFLQPQEAATPESTAPPAPNGAAGGTPAAAAQPAAADDEPLNLMSVAAGPTLRRLAPLVAALAVIVVALRMWSRRSSSRSL